MNNNERLEQLRERARELGFDLAIDLMHPRQQSFMGSGTTLMRSKRFLRR